MRQFERDMDEKRSGSAPTAPSTMYTCTVWGSENHQINDRFYS